MDNFLAMERKGRDLFKSLLDDGNITKYKESTSRFLVFGYISIIL